MKNDPWDMLNKFCFHVYAQKSVIIGQEVIFVSLVKTVAHTSQQENT